MDGLLQLLVDLLPVVVAVVEITAPLQMAVVAQAVVVAVAQLELQRVRQELQTLEVAAAAPITLARQQQVALAALDLSS